MSRLIVTVTLGTLALATGCTESGIGQFDGTVVAGPECLEGFLPFDSAFQTAVSTESNMTLLFQSDGGTPQGKDLIAFVHPDPESLAVGTAYDLGPVDIDEPPTFSGQLAAEESCPEMILSYYLTGTVTLTEYTGEDGTNVSGSLSDAEVLDARTDEIIMTGVSGTWDFTFQTGPPYEPYP